MKKSENIDTKNNNASKYNTAKLINKTNNIKDDVKNLNDKEKRSNNKKITKSTITKKNIKKIEPKLEDKNELNEIDKNDLNNSLSLIQKENNLVVSNKNSELALNNSASSLLSFMPILPGTNAYQEKLKEEKIANFKFKRSLFWAGSATLTAAMIIGNAITMSQLLKKSKNIKPSESLKILIKRCESLTEEMAIPALLEEREKLLVEISYAESNIILNDIPLINESIKKLYEQYEKSYQVYFETMNNINIVKKYMNSGHFKELNSFFESSNGVVLYSELAQEFFKYKKELLDVVDTPNLKKEDYEEKISYVDQKITYNSASYKSIIERKREKDQISLLYKEWGNLLNTIHEWMLDKKPKFGRRYISLFVTDYNKSFKKFNDLDLLNVSIVELENQIKIINESFQEAYINVASRESVISSIESLIEEVGDNTKNFKEKYNISSVLTTSSNVISKLFFNNNQENSFHKTVLKLNNLVNDVKNDLDDTPNVALHSIWKNAMFEFKELIFKIKNLLVDIKEKENDILNIEKNLNKWKSTTNAELKLDESDKWIYEEMNILFEDITYIKEQIKNYMLTPEEIHSKFSLLDSKRLKIETEKKLKYAKTIEIKNLIIELESTIENNKHSLDVTNPEENVKAKIRHMVAKPTIDIIKKYKEQINVILKKSKDKNGVEINVYNVYNHEDAVKWANEVNTLRLNYDQNISDLNEDLEKYINKDIFLKNPNDKTKLLKSQSIAFLASQISDEVFAFDTSDIKSNWLKNNLDIEFKLLKSDKDGKINIDINYLFIDRNGTIDNEKGKKFIFHRLKSKVLDYEFKKFEFDEANVDGLTLSPTGELPEEVTNLNQITILLNNYLYTIIGYLDQSKHVVGYGENDGLLNIIFGKNGTNANYISKNNYALTSIAIGNNTNIDKTLKVSYYIERDIQDYDSIERVKSQIFTIDVDFTELINANNESDILLRFKKRLKSTYDKILEWKDSNLSQQDTELVDQMNVELNVAQVLIDTNLSTIVSDEDKRKYQKNCETARIKILAVKKLVENQKQEKISLIENIKNEINRAKEFKASLENKETKIADSVEIDRLNNEIMISNDLINSTTLVTKSQLEERAHLIKSVINSVIVEIRAKELIRNNLRNFISEVEFYKNEQVKNVIVQKEVKEKINMLLSNTRDKLHNTSKTKEQIQETLGNFELEFNEKILSWYSDTLDNLEALEKLKKNIEFFNNKNLNLPLWNEFKLRSENVIKIISDLLKYSPAENDVSIYTMEQIKNIFTNSAKEFNKIKDEFAPLFIQYKELLNFLDDNYIKYMKGLKFTNDVPFIEQLVEQDNLDIRNPLEELYAQEIKKLNSIPASLSPATSAKELLKSSEEKLKAKYEWAILEKTEKDQAKKNLKHAMDAKTAFANEWFNEIRLIKSETDKLYDIFIKEIQIANVTYNKLDSNKTSFINALENLKNQTNINSTIKSNWDLAIESLKSKIQELLTKVNNIRTSNQEIWPTVIGLVDDPEIKNNEGFLAKILNNNQNKTYILGKLDHNSTISIVITEDYKSFRVLEKEFNSLKDELQDRVEEKKRKIEERAKFITRLKEVSCVFNKAVKENAINGDDGVYKDYIIVSNYVNDFYNFSKEFYKFRDHSNFNSAEDKFATNNQNKLNVYRHGVDEKLKCSLYHTDGETYLAKIKLLDQIEEQIFAKLEAKLQEVIQKFNEQDNELLNKVLNDHYCSKIKVFSSFKNTVENTRKVVLSKLQIFKDEFNANSIINLTNEYESKVYELIKSYSKLKNAYVQLETLHSNLLNFKNNVIPKHSDFNIEKNNLEKIIKELRQKLDTPYSQDLNTLNSWYQIHNQQYSNSQKNVWNIRVNNAKNFKNIFSNALGITSGLSIHRDASTGINDFLSIFWRIKNCDGSPENIANNNSYESVYNSISEANNKWNVYSSNFDNRRALRSSVYAAISSSESHNGRAYNRLVSCCQTRIHKWHNGSFWTSGSSESAYRNVVNTQTDAKNLLNTNSNTYDHEYNNIIDSLKTATSHWINNSGGGWGCNSVWYNWYCRGYNHKIW